MSDEYMTCRPRFLDAIPPGAKASEVGLDLLKRIRILEESDRQLGMIRATLILNYSDQRKHSGIILTEKSSTLSMLIDLVEAYDKLIPKEKN